MNRLSVLMGVAILLGLPATTFAQEPSFAFGGDQFTAGQNAIIAAPVANDAFIAGYDATISAPVGSDAHLAGFNVTVSSDVGGNVYAAGFSVTIGGRVGGDASALGNTVTLRAPEPVAGNARLAGRSVTLASGVAGSAIVTAQNFTLDGPIAGDLRFYGDTIAFGPGARVGGSVAIRAPREIAVPATVAAPERVDFEVLTEPDYVGEAGRAAEHAAKRFWPAFWTAAAWWVALLLVGAAFIAFMPGRLAVMEAASARRPFIRLGAGILAFSAVVGLVPVFAITLIGIPLVPFAIVFALIACSLAYLAGVYFAGRRLAAAFVPVTTNLHRLAVVAVSLVAAALLGWIPFVGWLLSLALLVFGFGVIAAGLFAGRGNARAPRPDLPAAATPLPGA